MTRARDCFQSDIYLQYVICAAIGSPLKSISISKNLPWKEKGKCYYSSENKNVYWSCAQSNLLLTNRLELLLVCVLALPMASKNIWAYSMRSRIFRSPPRKHVRSWESNDVTDEDSWLSRLRLTYDVELADRERYRTPRSLEHELFRCSLRASLKFTCKWSRRLMHLTWPQWSHLRSLRFDDVVDKLDRFNEALLLHVNKCCSLAFFFRLEYWFFKLATESSCFSAFLACWLGVGLIITRFWPVVLSLFVVADPATAAAVTFGRFSRLLYWCVRTNSTDLPWGFFYGVKKNFCIRWWLWKVPVEFTFGHALLPLTANFGQSAKLLHRSKFRLSGVFRTTTGRVLLTCDTKCATILAVSVLPALLSPSTHTHWCSFWSWRFW